MEQEYKDKVMKELGMEADVEVKSMRNEKEVKYNEAPFKVKEVGYSCRISPRNTYSSAEYTKVIEVYETDPAVISEIETHLRANVIDNTIVAAKDLITSAMNEGML